MFIDSNIWALKIYEINENTLNSRLAEVTTTTFNSQNARLSSKEIIDLSSVKSIISDDSLLLKNREVKIKVENRKELMISKFMGDFYSDEGIEWNTIENSLVGSIRIDNLEIPSIAPMADAESIDRFIMTKETMRGKISNSFKGDEQKKYLERFDEIATSIKNKLINTLAIGIGDFFNSNNSYVGTNNPSQSKTNSFDVEAFKKNILNIFEYRNKTYQNNEKSFEGDLGINYGKIVLTKGEYVESEMKSIEEMNFDDMKTIAKTVQEVNKSLVVFYSSSGARHVTEEILGMNLGEAKAKMSMVIKYSNMNTLLKDKFSRAMDKNIDRKIMDIISERQQRQEIGELSPINYESTKRIINSFEEAVFENSKNFREIFMNASCSVERIFLKNSTDYVNVVGYINPERKSVSDFIKKMSNETRINTIQKNVDKIQRRWNEFVDQIDIHNKKDYLLPEAGKHIINTVV